MSDVSGSTPSKWDDLKVRVASAVVMMLIGIATIIAGGVWFTLLVAVAAGLMVWELMSMIWLDQPMPPIVFGIAQAVIVIVQSQLSGAILWPLFLSVPLIGAIILHRHQMMFVVFALVIGIATYFLIKFRAVYGIPAVLWLLFIIIASDTLGYLAGRSFGGPKFWPSISPKKTWSGTIAGWVGAAVVGFIFANVYGFEPLLATVVVSVLVGFAGQMGDIAESALKRRVGIKDSSNLIPGHGGLLDRFDALLGAMLVIAVFMNGLPGFGP